MQQPSWNPKHSKQESDSVSVVSESGVAEASSSPGHSWKELHYTDTAGGAQTTARYLKISKGTKLQAMGLLWVPLLME